MAGDYFWFFQLVVPITFVAGFEGLESFAHNTRNIVKDCFPPRDSERRRREIPESRGTNWFGLGVPLEPNVIVEFGFSWRIYRRLHLQLRKFGASFRRPWPFWLRPKVPNSAERLT